VGPLQRLAAIFLTRTRCPNPGDVIKMTSNPGDVIKMTYCVGFLDALIASLEKNHFLYRAILPDPKLLQTDQATAKRYIATTLLIGPDACFPDGLKTAIAFCVQPITEPSSS
jgi:hypothetical protein